MSELPVEASVDDVHAHARQTGHRWFDVTMAVAAIFISIVSLYVAVEHGRTERDLVAASSWPFPRLLLSDQYGSHDDLAFGVSNGGTGPAKIHSFELAFDGKPVGSPVELLQRCCGLPNDRDGIRKALPPGSISMSAIDETVLRPGEDNPVLLLHRKPGNAPVADRFDAVLPRLSFRVCYCSVLDQCWTSDLRALDTARVKTCAPPRHRYRYTDRGN